MNKHFISIMGLGSLGLGCNSSPPSVHPPQINPPRISQPETFNPPPDTGPRTNLPSWESVSPPKAGAKAELILTPNGCYKNWVDAQSEPKDRYEANADTTKLGTLIECPDRAKELTKQPTKSPKAIEAKPQKP